MQDHDALIWPYPASVLAFLRSGRARREAHAASYATPKEDTNRLLRATHLPAAARDVCAYIRIMYSAPAHRAASAPVRYPPQGKPYPRLHACRTRDGAGREKSDSRPCRSVRRARPALSGVSVFVRGGSCAGGRRGTGLVPGGEHGGRGLRHSVAGRPWRRTLQCKHGCKRGDLSRWTATRKASAIHCEGSSAQAGT